VFCLLFRLLLTLYIKLTSQVVNIHVLELVPELLSQLKLVKLSNILHYLLFQPLTLLVLN
jgi:hypothetical protein